MRRIYNASIWRRMLLAAVIHVFTGSVQATQYNVTLSYGEGGGSEAGSATVTIDTEFNPVFAPASGEVVTAGSPYTIKWKTTSDVGMSFDLCQMVSSTQFTRVLPQNQEDGYVGSNELNNGAYVWNVGGTIPSGDNYVLLVDDGLVTAGISPVFSISNPSDSSSSGPSSSMSTIQLASTSFLSSSQTPTLTSSTSNPPASQPTEQGSTTSSTSPSSPAASDSAGSSSGPSPSIIGGAVGGALGGVILLLLAVIFFLLKRKQSKKTRNVGPEDHPEKELDGTPSQRVEADAGGIRTAVQPVNAIELPLKHDKELYELPTSA